MPPYLDERARREGITNLTGVLATATEARIPEPVDVILVVDTHHHIDDRPRYYRALHPSLRPGGRVVIVDFTMDSPIGPPQGARLTPAQVDAELSAAGFSRQGEALMLPNQYVLTYVASTPAADRP